MADRRALPVLSSDGSGPVGGANGDRSVGEWAAGVSAALDAAGVGPGTRVAMVTLGCDKNTVDSERILSDLVGAGMEMAASPAEADVVLVNTCGFIEAAKQESIDALLEAAMLKEAGRVRAVVGMGCLVQRYKPELETELPEVDLFLRLAEVDRLVPELASRGLVTADGPVMERPLRVLASAEAGVHSAHLKISEGCDHACAFCAIPMMRGKFRSTPPDLLVREARALEARGAVELNVVSQDTTWYGRDLARALARGGVASTGDGQHWFLGRAFEGMAGFAGSEAADDRGDRTSAGEQHSAGDLTGATRTLALAPLLEELLSETGVAWYRLFYMYPSGITPELVALMAREPRIVPYLDMPIQHGSDAVLAAMRRPERRATILERVRWLRDAIPDLALRTTVIVGFPGETEDDFEALLSLLEEIRFDHVGAFAYSAEEGTAAAAMPEQVPPAVRRERLERLLDLQRGISLEKNECRVGRRITVLVDSVDRDGAVARAPWQAPEVDGVVLIEDAAGLRPGALVEVEITEAEEYDLSARLV